jgi:enamine deaminase RidA (YjgF/YER057c/UK114 family)
MSVYERLETIGVVLPEMTPPVAAFAPWVRAGDLLYVSGHIAKKDGGPWIGRLGATLTTEDGRQAARGAAIDLMGTLHAATGDLGTVKQVVKLMVLVNSTARFTEQHLVANGASELLEVAFGSPHARSAFGVAQVPFGSCVEIEAVVQLA